VTFYRCTQRTCFWAGVRHGVRYHKRITGHECEPVEFGEGDLHTMGMELIKQGQIMIRTGRKFAWTSAKQPGFSLRRWFGGEA
jgi:hypothetical protein